MRPKPFERVCCVCRKRNTKNEFFRFCKIDGKIEADVQNCLGGKGAYICKECTENLSKLKGLNKAFRTNVNSEDYERIEKKLRSFDGRETK